MYDDGTKTYPHTKYRIYCFPHLKIFSLLGSGTRVLNFSRCKHVWGVIHDRYDIVHIRQSNNLVAKIMWYLCAKVLNNPFVLCRCRVVLFAIFRYLINFPYALCHSWMPHNHSKNFTSDLMFFLFLLRRKLEHSCKWADKVNVKNAPVYSKHLK